MSVSSPAIVVAAYNRAASLSRLLASLSNAFYTKNTKLIISIDKSNNDDVLEIASEFLWQHGEKEIIAHKKNLGLRKHILKCGDLTNLYESVVILEDDLYVSPYFYQYASHAINYYQDEKSVAGVSLYSNSFNHTAQLPFTPLLDGHDIYFMQLAASWGQAWTRSQWGLFKAWYDQEPILIDIKDIPKNILEWPETSWLKYFNAYLILKNKFFVFPRQSFTTNFSDTGTHHKNISSLFQVPLSYGNHSSSFSDFSSSSAKYDSYCEILPDCINTLTDNLSKINYCLDIYGEKPINSLLEYVITSKPCKSYIKSYGLQLKPPELNVLENIKGTNIVLAKKSDIISNKEQDFASIALKFEYFYVMPSIKTLVSLLFTKILTKLGLLNK